MFPGLSPLPSITPTPHRGPLPWEDGLARTLPSLIPPPTRECAPPAVIFQPLHPWPWEVIAPLQARGTQYRLAHLDKNERRRFQSTLELQACGRCRLGDFRWERGTLSLRRQHSKILSRRVKNSWAQRCKTREEGKNRRNKHTQSRGAGQCRR